MGLSLKGKELGKGISQRKDGRFSARYTTSSGFRKQKYFKSLSECRQWLAEELFKKEHCNVENYDEMTTETWYDYWFNELKKDNIKKNTRKTYNDRWRINVKPFIGNKPLNKVTAIDLLGIMKNMKEKNYADSTMNHTRGLLHQLFDTAVDLDIIDKNPVKRQMHDVKGRATEKKEALTDEELEKFLNEAKHRTKYNQYAFILQTGLRIGELIALTWDDIDFEKRMLTVNKTMEYRSSEGQWHIGTPKTKSSNRKIYLNDLAIDILKDQRRKNMSLKQIPIEFAKQVFLTRNGTPTKNSAYDTSIVAICDKVGIRRFGIHILRHTFATRCARAGMKPQVLKKIMGHAKIKTTMDIYVTVFDSDEMREMNFIQDKLIV